MNVSNKLQEALLRIGYDAHFQGKRLDDIVNWLREVKGLHCYTERDDTVLKCWVPSVYDLNDRNVVVWDDEPNVYLCGTYDLALTAAITKAIEIVEKEGEHG